MDNSEYFIRRAWDCHHLLARSADERSSVILRESERAFIARAIDAGVPANTLPPMESSALARPRD
ncbi:MAG TPA: hypothetical protein VKZ79_03905 [Alphaproteobacteria bacterium]|nr:hypothetical protein [Alphaproteobacteria bacterium]